MDYMNQAGGMPGPPGTPPEPLDPDDWCAIEMDVPHFGIVGQQPDGSKVWQATFVTPAGFFKFEESRLLGPDGQPANLAQQFMATFLQGVFPFVRLVCRRERVGDHVPFPPRNEEERAAMMERFGAPSAEGDVTVEGHTYPAIVSREVEAPNEAPE
jgi:hypothetical protein